MWLTQLIEQVLDFVMPQNGVHYEVTTRPMHSFKALTHNDTLVSKFEKKPHAPSENLSFRQV